MILIMSPADREEADILTVGKTGSTCFETDIRCVLTRDCFQWFRQVDTVYVPYSTLAPAEVLTHLRHQPVYHVHHSTAC